MSGELIWVLFLLFIAIILFVTNKIRMDVTALLVIVAFVLSKTLTLQEAIAGFSDPNVLLIATLFVIGDGLVRTGIAYKVGNWLMQVAGNSETKMLIFLMTSVALLGAFMSSTGVVAIFIPVALSVASRMEISPSRLMMPLGFAGLISGMMTLVATPPNMVVNSELINQGIKGFEFFSITPIGVLILLVGVFYMLIARYFLKSSSFSNQTETYKRTFRDLIRDYKLAGRARRLKIGKGSPMIGFRIEDLHLRAIYNANIVGIERWRKFRYVIVSATTQTQLQEKDILLIDIPVDDEEVRRFCFEQKLEPMILRGNYFSEQVRDVGMAEVCLNPDSELIGKTIKDIKFRTRYGLNVIGIRRAGVAIDGKLVDEPLHLGDVLLVIGDWKLIRALSLKIHNFIVLNVAAEVQSVVPASSQAPHALFCLILMVILMVANQVPNFIAALIACLLMGKFRCIDMESAYKSIHWPSIILIVGMMPFALALQKTGGIDLAVKILMSVAGDLGPYVMLICLFVFCAVTGLFISNTATAVLMAPIAIAAAKQMEVSPLPFAMIVGIAASAAFMTPVSSPVNTLVLGPGGYKFTDFLKIGVPFTIIVMIISVIVVPILFPF